MRSPSELHVKVKQVGYTAGRFAPTCVSCSEDGKCHPRLRYALHPIPRSQSLFSLAHPLEETVGWICHPFQTSELTQSQIQCIDMREDGSSSKPLAATPPLYTVHSTTTTTLRRNSFRSHRRRWSTRWQMPPTSPPSTVQASISHSPDTHKEQAG